MRLITTKQTSGVVRCVICNLILLGFLEHFLVAESDNSEKIKSFLFKMMIKDKVPVLVLTSGRTRVRVADKT